MAYNTTPEDIAYEISEEFDVHVKAPRQCNRIYRLCHVFTPNVSEI